MTTAPTLDLRHFTHDDLPEIRQTIIDVHADAYADDMTEFDERFPWFVDHWGGHPGFACVIAYDGDRAVGFAYGAPANPQREWWREHLDPAPEKDRTFSFSELAVAPQWRKKGVADRLSRALMADRTRTSRSCWWTSSTPASRRCTSPGGYRKVGERQPFPDSPTYAVMIAELPLT